MYNNKFLIDAINAYKVVDCLENNPDYFFKIRNLGATASAEIIRKVDKILHIFRFEKKFLKTGE